MSAVIERHVEWTSPASLWDQFAGPTDGDQRRLFRTPAILRFASDAFMQEFLDLMQVEPHRLRELLAVPEKWTSPAASVTPPARTTGRRLRLERARGAAVRRLEARRGLARASAWNAAPAQQPLKLYQPAHQRYYLVAACLVCRTMGLPDRPLDTGAHERATFVIRMLKPPTVDAVNPDPAICRELAFVGGEWQPVAAPDTLAPGEEQYPLSPLTYVESDGRKRRLFNGFIPVGKRETLGGARQPSASPPLSATLPSAMDPRRVLLGQQVSAPWGELEGIAARAVTAAVYDPSRGGSAPSQTAVDTVIRQANEQIQMVAWYILLDLSHWLEAHVPAVWSAMQPSGAPASLGGKERDLYDALGALTSGGQSLRIALRDIRAFAQTLEGATTVYRQNQTGWPAVTFQFVHVGPAGVSGLVGHGPRDALEQKLVDVLAAPRPGVPVPVVAQASSLPFESPWFTIRCVMERPNCAALSEPVVSEPTAAVQLAAFFDSDAPARPIRIGMPADTTPAGLRKYDKNTAFVMSDVLCGQMSALGKLSFVDLVLAVLPFPFHKGLGIDDAKPCSEGGGGFGMVCSLSIPIITICALILLMIFVKLLDMVLFWMPFFQVCLPLPKKEA